MKERESNRQTERMSKQFAHYCSAPATYDLFNGASPLDILYSKYIRDIVASYDFGI